MGLCPARTYFFLFLLGLFYLLHSKAPLSVLAGRLIAIRACRAKAGKIALIELFLADDGRNNLPEAGIA